MNFLLNGDIRAGLLRLQGWSYEFRSMGKTITGEQFLRSIEIGSFFDSERLVAYAVYNAKGQIICDPSAPGRQSTGRLVVTNYRVIFCPDFISEVLTIPLVNIKAPQLKSKMFSNELIQIEFISSSVSRWAVQANPGGFSDDQSEFFNDTPSEGPYQTSKIDFLARKKRASFGRTFFENLKYAHDQAVVANGETHLMQG